MVKGQNIAIRMLEHEIKRDSLPQTLLFYGPESCGKFLTALELVRIINCKHNRAPNCICSCCTDTEKLISTDLFIICKSNLRNTFDLWKGSVINGANVRYFKRDLRRFVISISGDEKYRNEIIDLQNFLRIPDNLFDNPNAVLEIVYKVLDSQKGRVITIDMIRDVQRFLSLKSGYSRYRAVIIDGAENMNEEASNSFLKISEDTPSGSIIILTVVLKEALKETILSRCRLYRFIGLPDDILLEIKNKRLGSSEESTNIGLSYDVDIMRGYYEQIIANINDLGVMMEVADAILAHKHTIGFFDYTIDSLVKRINTLFQYSMDEIYEIEGMLKKIAFVKKAILYNNVNREIAITDFLLNNMEEILKYY